MPDLTYYVERFASNAGVFENLASGVGIEQARWKPSPEKWSLLEVVNHLYDEERDDFRARLDSLLHHPERKWPPIAPQEWAFERHYNAREPGESMERFLEERR